MTTPRTTAFLSRERGLPALALLLAVNAALCLYSAVVGISEAVAFVHPEHPALPKLSGDLRSYGSLVPATQQFGYFAPQVCSEFRVQVRLGASQTVSTQDVTFPVNSEAQLLLASLNSAAQEEAPARAIAASYATYALSRYNGYDFARVYIQAEYLPPLSEATWRKPQWINVWGYYFKK